MKSEEQQKIVTITLNPALDHTVHIPQFQTGEVNRAQQQRIDPGGKGINVAKVVRALGYPVAVTGFLGQDNSKVFNEYFQRKAIDNFFVEVTGAARVNIKIVDEHNGQVTEINFPGLISTSPDLAKLTGVIRRLTDDRQYFVISGSLPQGLPDTIYGQLIEILKGQRVKVLLDSSGAALREGIKALPDAIKPNLEELSQLMGKSLEKENDIRKAIAELLAGGIKQVVVTLGSQGAIIADKEQTLRVRPPAVIAKSTVGAGDALVAGFVVGQTRGLSLAECARLGTAAATASVIQPGTQAGSIKEVARLLAEIDIR
ncbi:1-phosphofructokinase [Anaerospora hongkongensis]|uniref:1-phosphofructokinase n=1 Tax=Anaerospora hongkongensis TaxID=244830 RepID=UPI002897EA8F|nr:1-phosphofructokinase [Anaerospora hongkongensis]